MRRIDFLIVCAFIACGFGECHYRAATAKQLASDGSTGAAIGAVIAGPAGAPIGAAIAMLLGIVARSYEKGKLKEKAAAEKTELTQDFAKKLEAVAPTRRTYREVPDNHDGLIKNDKLDI